MASTGKAEFGRTVAPGNSQLRASWATLDEGWAVDDQGYHFSHRNGCRVFLAGFVPQNAKVNHLIPSCGKRGW
jgi:hypothetical protein